MKKKIFCLLFLLLCAVTSINALATENDSIKIKYSGIENNVYSNVTAEFSAENIASGEDVYCIAAKMSNHTLISAQMKKITADSSGIIDVEINFDDVFTDTDVKAYMWDSEMTPIVNTNNVERSYNIYVSTNGNDEENNGSKTEPFNTIERAKNEVSTVKNTVNKNIEVNIESGVYYISEALNFTPDDGGTDEYSVKYTGSDDTYIDGGIKVGSFTDVEGKDYLQADFDSDEYIYEMYVNGHRVKAASTEFKFMPTALYDDEETQESTDGFVFSGEDKVPFELDSFDGVMLSNTYEWTYMLCPVIDYISDDNSQTFVLPQPYFSWYRSNHHSLNYPIYFINSMQFLDTPGEFYFDKENSKLYYYPLDGEKAENIEVYVPKAEKLISISGSNEEYVKNLEFSNITFRHGQWTRTWEKGFSAWQAESYIDEWTSTADQSRWTNIIPAQVEISYADNIKITNSRFENLSAGAVRFSDSCINSQVSGNIFYDIGGAAVTIGNASHREAYFGQSDKICKNIKVTNNLIRATGQIYQSSCAITAYYVNRCTISHNDIKDVPYSGISLGWGWGNDEPLCFDNIISNNKITDVMHSLWDGSHIYTLGSMPGTVISGNYLGRYDNDCGGGGYYPDQGSADILYKNNVTENAYTWNINWSNTDIEYVNNYVTYFKEYTSGNIASEEQKAGFIECPDGNWNEEALEIINNAGLESNYSHLYEEFETEKNNVFVIKTDLQRYFSDDFFFVEGGNFIREGGEGVSYHDLDEYNTSDAAGIGPDYGGRMNRIMSIGTGEWLTYNITAPKTGYYNIYARSAVYTGNNRCYISVNGKEIRAHKYLRNTGAWAKYDENYIGRVMLLEGVVNSLKIEFEGSFNFAGLVFDYAKPYNEGDMIEYEFVIDELDAEVSFVGDAWENKKGYDYSYGFNSHKSLISEGNADSYAEFSVDFLESGVYEIYSYIPVPNSTSLSKVVSADILCDTGVYTVSYSSYVVPSGWVKLDGEYQITNGNKAYVRLYPGEEYRTVRADAIKFVKISDIK